MSEYAILQEMDNGFGIIPVSLEEGEEIDIGKIADQYVNEYNPQKDFAVVEVHMVGRVTFDEDEQQEENV